MEVHPPEHALRSWKDFFIHIATITIGLLIALSLEGTVGWFHHRALVREAKEHLRAELTANKNDVDHVIASIPAAEQQYKTMLQNLSALPAHGTLPGMEPSLKPPYAFLKDINWKTAQGTGATGYMSYEQLAEYTTAYGVQEKFLHSQDAIINETLSASGIFVAGKSTSVTDADIQKAREHLLNLVSRVDVQAQLGKLLSDSYSKILTSSE